MRLFPGDLRHPAAFPAFLDGQPARGQRVQLDEVEAVVQLRRQGLVELQRLQRSRRIVRQRPLRFGGIRRGHLVHRRRSIRLERHGRDHRAVVIETPRHEVGITIIASASRDATPSTEDRAEVLSLPPPASGVGESVLLIPRHHRVTIGVRQRHVFELLLTHGDDQVVEHRDARATMQKVSGWHWSGESTRYTGQRRDSVRNIGASTSDRPRNLIDDLGTRGHTRPGHHRAENDATTGN